MALITLGGKPHTSNNKLNNSHKKGDLTPEEIRDAIKNMNSNSKNELLKFLILKVKEEKEEVLKAMDSINEILKQSVILKDAHPPTDNIKATYEAIIDVLESDFAGMLDYQIDILKAERKKLIKDLSLKHFNEFNKKHNL